MILIVDESLVKTLSELNALSPLPRTRVFPQNSAVPDMESLLGALETAQAATVAPPDGRTANSSVRDAPQEVLTSVAPRQRPKAGLKAPPGGPMAAPVLPLPPQGTCEERRY